VVKSPARTQANSFAIFQTMVGTILTLVFESIKITGANRADALQNEPKSSSRLFFYVPYAEHLFHLLKRFAAEIVNKAALRRWSEVGWPLGKRAAQRVRVTARVP
jgi:hypothetical protein